MQVIREQNYFSYLAILATQEIQDSKGEFPSSTTYLYSTCI